MVSTVIVPLDGSEASEQALPYAKMLAERERANLTLMSVVEISNEFDAWVETAALSLQDELDEWIQERRQYLQAHAEQLGADTNVVVRVGRPADQIRALAEEMDDPLLVIASSGRGGIQQFVLGSVALKVVQDVRSPVVVVRIRDEAPVPRELDCLLLPLDGSEFSAQIVDVVLEIVGEPRPRLELVRVLETPNWSGRAFNAGLVGQFMDATREMAEDDLSSMAQQLREAGFEVDWSLRGGNAGDEIIKAAEERGANMIAMATHGRGGLGRLLLGSVAQRVLNRATVPLLLVRPREE